MPMDPFANDPPLVRGRRRRRPSDLDIQAAIVALTGGSALDWSGLRFRSLDEVDSFLRLWLIDVKQEWARARLDYVYNQSWVYLEDQLHYDMPREIRRLVDPREAFLRASDRTVSGRLQRDYCRVLKMMHVVNHHEMQELRAETAVSEVELMELARQVVERAAERMRKEGIPIHAFYGSRKARPSVITKLLVKSENTAAAIHDKFRYKIVAVSRSDIIPVLSWLFRRLIPFPSVIPAQGHNSLLAADELNSLVRMMNQYDGPPDPSLLPSPNPFSDRAYSAMTFVFNLPVRVYDATGVRPPRHRFLLGEAVMMPVELQIVDAATDAANETGERRHELYKQRQMERVRERLGRSGLPRVGT